MMVAMMQANDRRSLSQINFSVHDTGRISKLLGADDDGEPHLECCVWSFLACPSFVRLMMMIL